MEREDSSMENFLTDKNEGIPSELIALEANSLKATKLGIRMMNKHDLICKYGLNWY